MTGFDTRMTTAGTSIWRRIRRHTATVAAWFMVLLALGLAGLWVDWRHLMIAEWQWVDPEHNTVRHFQLLSGQQVFHVQWERRVTTHKFIGHYTPGLWLTRMEHDSTPRRRWWYQTTAFGADWPWNSFGLARGRFTPADYSPLLGGATDGVTCSVLFPHWFVLLLLLPWPVRRGWAWLEVRRRRRKGLCWNCGYDLRASPGRCPECGMEKRC